MQMHYDDCTVNLEYHILGLICLFAATLHVLLLGSELVVHDPRCRNARCRGTNDVIFTSLCEQEECSGLKHVNVRRN